jgi:hypothetical protein
LIENEGEALNEAEPNTEGAESPNEDNTPDISQHEEAVAKARGWVAKEEFRGKPETWQDAKSFLDRNASLQNEVKQLRDKVTEQEETYADRIRRIEAANDRILREDRERTIRDISRGKRAAVELGDVDEFDRLDREENDYFKRQIEADRALDHKPERQAPKAPDLMPETQDWLRRNSWFHESQNMQAIALGFYGEANEGMPAAKDELKRLAYVDKRMAEVYPEKFGGGNRSNSVEGGTRNLQSNKVTSLTAEERAACRKFIAKGIIKNEAEYIKYLNEYD